MIITNKAISKNEEIPDGRFILMVVVFIQNSSEKFLMQKRSQEKGGDWVFTDGHPKEDTPSLQEICMEVKEKFGIPIDNLILFKESMEKNTSCNL